GEGEELSVFQKKSSNPLGNALLFTVQKHPLPFFNIDSMRFRNSGLVKLKLEPGSNKMAGPLETVPRKNCTEMGAVPSAQVIVQLAKKLRASTPTAV
ncbi:hypothetical protein, partial [Paenibacillus oceani]|uniref:hypothetical protein n=1 Tax=Paenibacillus oceani TaxID=2772510 RepID=UPI001CC2281E